MSNGRPATMRDVRQDAGFRSPRQPTRVGQAAVLAYTDPGRDAGRFSLVPRRSHATVEARASAIEDARVDCRSTILRNPAKLPR